MTQSILSGARDATGTPDNPEVCFGILAHTNPIALKSLLKALDGHVVIIHLDLGVERVSYERALGDLSENIRFVSSENSFFVNWGGISVVDAEVAIIQDYLKVASENSYLFFLSGECYPIRPVSEFCKALTNQESHFVCNLQEIQQTSDFSKRKILKRYTKLWFRDLRIFLTVKDRSSFKYRFRNLVIKLMQKTTLIFGISKKLKEPVAFGTQWIAGHVTFFRKVLPLYPQLRSEFKNTLAPDEMLFHSIYLRMSRSLNKSVISTVENPVINAKFHLIHESLNYEWKVSDLDLIRNSGKYFARKMSPELLRIFS